MAAIGRRAWQLYRVVVTLIAAAVLVEFFLVGRGVFGIRGGAELEEQASLDPHRLLGNIIGGAALVLLVLAVVIWDRRLIVWSAVITVLAAAVQRAVALPEHPWVSGLHPVSGLAIFLIAGSLSHRAWRHRGKAESAA